MEKMKPFQINEIKIFTDMGGVLIGNQDFKILIPNGYGDGRQTIIIGSGDYVEKVIKENELNYFTFFDGKEVNIYNDEGQTIEILPEGEYAIWFGKDTIVFAEC